MKINLKKIVPLAAALALVIGIPHLKHDEGCGCTAPVIFFGSILGCSEPAKQAEAVQKPAEPAPQEVQQLNNSQSAAAENAGKPLVTFVELGSVNCIPCKMMQPVMDKVEKTYGGQVKVIFYDVWTEAGKPYAFKYGIRGIPTQVFLDSRGNEIARHTGFLPYEEVDKVLKSAGVK